MDPLTVIDVVDLAENRGFFGSQAFLFPGTDREIIMIANTGIE